MGRKYITNQQDINYVYPNNVINQYDVEIVHDVNNNCVTGTVTNFSAVTYTTTGMTFSFDYTWNLNGAERMLNYLNTQTMVWSLHGMHTPTNAYGTPQGYFNPWRIVSYGWTNTTNTSVSGTHTTILTPAELGMSTFPASGTSYEFEIRMISRNCILPICKTLTF